MSDELIVIEREDALKAFTDEQAFDAMFNQIKTLAEEVKPDLTSAKGRKEHKSFCFKIRKTKARIDDVRTDLTEDMRKQISAINARGAAMVERLEELHTTVRQPLTDWEEAEKLRVETIRKTIEDARTLGQVRFGETSRQIQERMDKLPTHDLDWYAEFKDEADLVIQAAFNGLSIAKTAALNAEKEAAEREAERAELARLKKAEEERVAKERAAEEERKAEEARREQEKREADEKVAAERAAAEQKQAELQRQLDEANRKAADAEKAAKEAQEREAKAVEEERRRQDEERAAEERWAEEARIAAEREAEQSATDEARLAEDFEVWHGSSFPDSPYMASVKAIESIVEATRQMEPVVAAERIVAAIIDGKLRHIRVRGMTMLEIREWDGTTIKEPGLYSGIPIETYHNDQSLLPGPSVSKSSLKAIAPPDGSPKQFWQTWAGNPRRVKSRTSKALGFGKAVHALVLGDEVFEEKFVVRPEKVEGETYHGQKTVWKRWYREQEQEGLTVVTEEQIEQIRIMAEDLAQHPLVVAGGLNGQVEVSMFARDPVTGIWLKSRPDNLAADGVYVDLKTAGSLDQQFLERQFHDAGDHLQPAMTKMVCDLLGIPFQSFTFLYTLTDGYADSDFRVAYEGDILLGEKVIRYGLSKIRHGLDTGEWPGISTYARENLPIGMNDFSRKRIEAALKQEGFSQ